MLPSNPLIASKSAMPIQTRDLPSYAGVPVYPPCSSDTRLTLEDAELIEAKLLLELARHGNTRGACANDNNRNIRKCIFIVTVDSSDCFAIHFVWCPEVGSTMLSRYRVRPMRDQAGTNPAGRYAGNWKSGAKLNDALCEYQIYWNPGKSQSVIFGLVKMPLMTAAVMMPLSHNS
jgi:hypothetical protein